MSSGRGKGARDVLGDAFRIVNPLDALGHALGARAEKGVVVDLLKSLAVARFAGHVTHEQHHGRGVLVRRVQADGGVGGARPARHEADAGAAGQLALRLGHEGRAALLPVGHEADAVGVCMEAVEHGEVTFTRHAEGVGHALGNQAFNEQVSGELCGHGFILQKAGQSALGKRASPAIGVARERESART
jgi:hypothetical protein